MAETIAGPPGNPSWRAQTAPLAALALGAVAMGASPIFVRTADVGPFASAFGRVALALPILWAWAHWEARRGRTAPAWPIDRAVVLAGLFFAGDLFFWHLSILATSVANAALLASVAPVWVVLGSGIVLGETVARPVFFGLALCLAGATILFAGSAAFDPQRLLGDAYALVTSLFFGGYFLAIRAAARRLPPGRIAFQSTLVTAALLLVVALTLDDRLLPQSLGGVGSLAGLAFVSQAGGHGLLAFALTRLPAAFSSLVIFLEPVAAALLAWLWLSEAVSPLQAAGGALILAGIALARPRRADAVAAA